VLAVFRHQGFFARIDMNTDDTPTYPRHIRSRIIDALADTRVVFLLGARQVGKSTLSRSIAENEHPASTVTLDDTVFRDAALSDPAGFLSGLNRPVVIDEVQRAPDLLLEIKRDVDRDTRPGRYLLTGSANVVSNRRILDALTGRMEIVRLAPLTQAEVHRSPLNVVDAFFEARPPRIIGAPVGLSAVAGAIAGGGYPEARLRSGARRDRWFASYLETTLDRDLRDISDARKLDHVPRLLRHLAAQSARLFSARNVATRLDLSPDTVRDYVALLQTVFLIHILPAWRPGLGQREVQTPKLHVTDSGLLLHLLGADEARVGSDDQVTGRVFESFVAMEVLRHVDWSAVDARVYHYRRRDEEIDLVIESRAGDVVAIEVKAGATPRVGDWAPLARLRDSLGRRFRAGILIHTGEVTIPLGDRLWAVPVSGLWTGDS
jgi:predicted AAA+ superfamily ATPase